MMVGLAAVVALVFEDRHLENGEPMAFYHVPAFLVGIGAAIWAVGRSSDMSPQARFMIGVIVWGIVHTGSGGLALWLVHLFDR